MIIAKALILLNEVKLYFWIRCSQHIIDYAALSESVLKDLATINLEWTALMRFKWKCLLRVRPKGGRAVNGECG